MPTGETIKDSLDRSDLNTLADMFRLLKLGGIVASLNTALRKAAQAVSPYVLATVRTTDKQQQFAPAATILSAYARAGTAAPVVLAPVAYPPAGNQIAVAPNGSIVTLAADAWTDFDVLYTVEKGDVYELVAPVSANVLTLPPFVTDRGAVLLLEVEATAGTATGKKIIDATGTAPAAAHAALTAAKATVAFNAADAVTEARVRLLFASSVDVSGTLGLPSTFE